MVTAAESWWPFGEHGDGFRSYIAQRTGTVTNQTLEAIAAEVPELVGPDPRLRELLSSVIAANLDNLGAVIAYRIAAASAFEPPAAIEHARLLAQRGIPSSSMLRGEPVEMPGVGLFVSFLDAPRCRHVVETASGRHPRHLPPANPR